MRLLSGPCAWLDRSSGALYQTCAHPCHWLFVQQWDPFLKIQASSHHLQDLHLIWPPQGVKGFLYIYRYCLLPRAQCPCIVNQAVRFKVFLPGTKLFWSECTMELTTVICLVVSVFFKILLSRLRRARGQFS